MRKRRRVGLPRLRYDRGNPCLVSKSNPVRVVDAFGRHVSGVTSLREARRLARAANVHTGAPAAIVSERTGEVLETKPAAPAVAAPAAPSQAATPTNGTARPNVRPLDEHAMRELELYIDNERELYRQRLEIERNLTAKIAKGRYDPAKAPKLWQYLIDRGAKKYVKEFGGEVRLTFPKTERAALATRYARDFEGRFERGEVENPRSEPNPHIVTDASGQILGAHHGHPIQSFRRAAGQLKNDPRADAIWFEVRGHYRKGQQYQPSFWSARDGPVLTSEQYRNPPPTWRPDTITINMITGPVQVEATVYQPGGGLFAVHRAYQARGWKVTHIPTGRSVVWYGLRSEPWARRVVRAIIRRSTERGILHLWTSQDHKLIERGAKEVMDPLIAELPTEALSIGRNPPRGDSQLALFENPVHYPSEAARAACVALSRSGAQTPADVQRVVGATMGETHARGNPPPQSGRLGVKLEDLVVGDQLWTKVSGALVPVEVVAIETRPTLHARRRMVRMRRVDTGRDLPKLRGSAGLRWRQEKFY